MTAGDVFAVAQEFRPDVNILDIQEYGHGNLNDTFLVTCNLATRETRFILQRVNTAVFRQPELIMLNMRTWTEHVHGRLQREQTGRRWVVPRVFSARDGRDYTIDAHGSFWRAMSFVENATTYESVQSIEHAREAGYAIGRFHSLISDLGTDKLHDTLEGFHITPCYLEHYDEVLAHVDVKRPTEASRAHSGPTFHVGRLDSARTVRHCLRFVMERREWASVLEDAKAQGKLRLRPIHGDPKVNNIMIDNASGQAISLVDLDTVKPGLVHYDIGDCLRSCCNRLGEETECFDDVHFEVDLCRAILEGYLSVAKGFLNEHDYAYLYDSIRLIAFELGLRFFTDYLEGNVYFKAKHRAHNLLRALVQFKVAESIESQETAIRAIIADLTGT